MMDTISGRWNWIVTRYGVVGEVVDWDRGRDLGVVQFADGSMGNFSGGMLRTECRRFETREEAIRAAGPVAPTKEAHAWNSIYSRSARTAEARCDVSGTVTYAANERAALASLDNLCPGGSHALPVKADGVAPAEPFATCGVCKQPCEWGKECERCTSPAVVRQGADGMWVAVCSTRSGTLARGTTLGAAMELLDHACQCATKKHRVARELPSLKPAEPPTPLRPHDFSDPNIGTVIKRGGPFERVCRACVAATEGTAGECKPVDGAEWAKRRNELEGDGAVFEPGSLRWAIWHGYLSPQRTIVEYQGPTSMGIRSLACGPVLRFKRVGRHAVKPDGTR